MRLAVTSGSTRKAVGERLEQRLHLGEEADVARQRGCELYRVGDHTILHVAERAARPTDAGRNLRRADLDARRGRLRKPG